MPTRWGPVGRGSSNATRVSRAARRGVGSSCTVMRVPAGGACGAAKARAHSARVRCPVLMGPACANLGLGREADHHGRALAGSAVAYEEPTSMVVLHHPARERESEPPAAPLGGIAGLE